MLLVASKIFLPEMHKIIYVSYHYPPSNSIGSLRSFNQVQALRELGHKVKVLYAGNENNRFVKNNTIKNHFDDHCLIDEVLVENSKSGFITQIKKIILRTVPNKIINLVNAFLIYFMGESPRWISKKVVNDAIEIHTNFKPDIIISTCGPLENHIFASKLKEIQDCYWIAEYRDCWSCNTMAFSENPLEIPSRLLRHKERKSIQKVDLILAVSPTIQKYYREFFYKKTILVYSGWVEYDYPINQPRIINKHNNKLKILHLGSMLHGRRSPIDIFNIFERNKEIRNSFEMYFIGRDTDVFTKKLSNTKYAKDSIFLNNEINNFQARDEGRAADLLLILMMEHKGDQNTVTGKIYEYIYLQKPIIILDSHNSEASKIICNYKLGYICKDQFSLERLLCEIAQNGINIEIADEIRDKFKVSNCMGLLLKKIVNETN